MTEVAKRTLLLVDDDPLVIAIIGKVLTNAGYEVVEARTANEAIAHATTQHVDLALLDVELPGMSGIDLAQHLQMDGNVPFMFISSHGEAEIVKQATEFGAVGYLLKPFEPPQILPAVEAALARAEEIGSLRRSEAGLTAALHTSRETSMAIGILMSKFDIDRNAAFDVLRAYSRSTRTKISEVADRLLAAQELYGELRSLISKPSSKGP